MDLQETPQGAEFEIRQTQVLAEWFRASYFASINPPHRTHVPCYFVQCAQGTTWRAGWNSDYGPHPRVCDSMGLSGIWEFESLIKLPGNSPAAGPEAHLWTTNQALSEDTLD